MPRKKTVSELQIAELKYQSLVEKRNDFNADARVFREERDALHAQKRELLDEMEALKAKRNALVEEMRLHKARRNELQTKAKRLIASRRTQKQSLKRGLDGEIQSLQGQISRLEHRQETVPMDLKKENELLDDLKKNQTNLDELMRLYDEQRKILRGIEGADGTIDELFRRADQEHALVVERYQQSHDVHEKYIDLVKEVSHLIAESNKKHEQFLKIRERADHYHRRAVEMREKILGIRREQQAERREARKFIKDQRRRRADAEAARAESVADEALDKLLKKGKVELK